MRDPVGAVEDTLPHLPGLGANGGPGGTGNHAYLLVIVGGTTRVFPLVDPSIVTIGRDAQAGLQIDHSSVSRLHARVQVQHGEVRISDLDSLNGTRVNGQRVLGARALLTGDVIAIGDALLVVHAELGRSLAPVILDAASWHRRLVDETERAVRYARPLAVLAISRASSQLASAFRAIDVIGQSADGELLALLPEADPATARHVALAVVEAVRSTRTELRVGLASCPHDANDADSLVLAARRAAASARPGAIAMASDAAQRIVLGDREVLIGHPAMASVFELLFRLAPADLTVLILGETGVGKENAAFALHHCSKRKHKQFHPFNCAAFPEPLIESALFGHDKGAFTGATAARPGLLESADGGTLFLDEIGELGLAVQAKLLRAIETRKIVRVGEQRERPVEFRLVAATHKNLEHEVQAQRFRADLFFRLGEAHVHLPPLRERRCEIPMLFREFVAQFARRANRPAPQPTPAVVQRLLAFGWAGNVRELRNVAEYVVATAEDERIELEDLPPKLQPPPDAAAPAAPAAEHHGPMRRLADEIQELERSRMLEALTRCNQVKTRAAAMIDMPIRTFNLKFKQYRL